MDTDISLQPPSRALQGKVAAQTGARCAGEGLGNGRAISIMLADEGCRVFCLDQDLSWAARTAEIANSKPSRGQAIATAGNITLAVVCKAAVQKTNHSAPEQLPNHPLLMVNQASSLKTDLIPSLV